MSSEQMSYMLRPRHMQKVVPVFFFTNWPASRTGHAGQL